MFEGLVRQLILGYLGRYVKDIQKEQLKITLWNEEVLLENIELILEAFDYLQLPFALKQGRVGRLSIKIPWKKLGWDPIIIVLEDVFICASQRDDQEWSFNAVERREFAGKKAKLAAAELAKLSRRVCDNQAGQSFSSYITAKILDSIQVSIRNFHVLYSDVQTDLAQHILGLRFSSLTIMKQNPIGSASGRVRGGQVAKIVEIVGLEIYCNASAVEDLIEVDNIEYFESWSNARFEGRRYDHIMSPFDVSMSLLVDKSGKLDNNAPQYSVSAELTSMVLSLNEVQLQQILILWDYLSTCQLREKYGRYRPSCSSLLRKPKGWQNLWWQYAQDSILSDVRKKLKKTSWRYLGQRLNYRRKYVNLYKIKLDFLRQEQSIDEYILRELEQMEKESDIDDILSYRSAAERELQDSLSKFSTSNAGLNGANISTEKSQNDERSSGRSVGWLNWLSRGMLGAGGTDDSSQFSGVVSDEVVKDIYEATKFQPMVSFNGDAAANDKVYTCAIKFSVHQIHATLRSMKSGQEIAELTLNGATIECKVWEEFATIIAFINSGEIVHSCNQKILIMRKAFMEKSILEDEQPSCRVQVDVSPNQEFELSVKVMIQPLEVTCDAIFFRNFVEFFNIFKSFKFQHERVLLSLNGIEDIKARLLSKAEYILSRRNKVIWDVSINNVIINVPWKNANLEQCNMVLELGVLLFVSKCDMDSLASCIPDQPLNHFLNSISTSNFFMGFQLQDLYDHYELKLNDFGIKIMTPYPQTNSILEKFGASIVLESCVIPDESILKQLEVYITVSLLHAHLSPSIYGSILELIAHLDLLYSRSEPTILENINPPNITSNQLGIFSFGFSITVNLEFVTFHIDLANDGENSNALILTLRDLDVRYALKGFEEGWICARAFQIVTYPLRNEMDNRILCSSGNLFAANSALQHGTGVELGGLSENFNDKITSAEACFRLHYEGRKSVNVVVSHKCSVFLNDADLHCYPYIFGLLIGFYNKISAYGTFRAGENSFGPTLNAKQQKMNPGFWFQRFGFSNFFESGSSEYASTSLDCFPFVTIHNSGSLGSLDSSLVYPIPEWRKYFNLRDRKIRSPKCNVKKESGNFHVPPLESTLGLDAFPASGMFGDASLIVTDLNLFGTRVHFHDSSCILGTFTLTTSTSSLFFYENFMDILCSTEGLTLSSSWWNQNFSKFLWGPSQPNLSPILNIRARKGNVGSLCSQLEVSIGIQHVRCILPPEYLAIIIGYFSLPDWGSNSIEQPVTQNHVGLGNESTIVYKFEILDSALIVPVENDDHQFLKLGIPELYCSFIHKTDLSNVLKDIPPECLVPYHKVAKRNNCLNVFGRGLILSFLMCKDDGYARFMFDPDTGCTNITLIAPLSVDVWVRIPCENELCSGSSSNSTCFMARIHNCQLIADGCYIFCGFEALLDVINRFSSIQDESEGFTDVLQFLQLKKSLKENGAVSAIASSMILTEVRCCVDSVLINLNHLRKEPNLLEHVAKVDMQFICSASLKNETPLSLDFSFSSLAIHSLLSSVVLAQCSSSCSTSSVLNICLLKSNQDENVFQISLPALDIWLHLFDWSKVVDLFNSYAGKFANSALMDASSNSSTNGTVDPIGNEAVAISQGFLQNSSMSDYFVPKTTKNDTIALIVRSENVGITVHFPFWVNEETSSEVGVAEERAEKSKNVASNITDGKHYKFIAVTTLSRSSELTMVGKNAKLKVSLEKTSGTMRICEDKSDSSWPFFQMFQINVETQIHNNQMNLAHVDVEVQCDRVDVWLSHHVFFFCHDVGFNLPEAGSSQFAFSGLNLKIQLREVSLLLTDGRWSCSGPLFQILVRNFLLDANVVDNSMESSVTSDLQVNYNNIEKVLWEPFVEPWKFQINMIRKHEMTALIDGSITTDIHFASTARLNLNFTESLVECVFRTTEMIRDAWGLKGGSNHLPESQIFLNPCFAEYSCAGRYAPYILQNLTSVPLFYHIDQGLVNSDEFDISEIMDRKHVQPGSSVPIYINETPEEQLFRYRPTDSSDRLGEKHSNGVAHHFMKIQLDGTSVPSAPISMDFVGLTYFEVDFSKASSKKEVEKPGDASKHHRNIEENSRTNADNGFVFPVVFDVSVQRYSKLIRLYSTVILLNSTAVPLELRFDIPFGVSPKILDPINPGQEFPLPLHLAEAGRIRWRPLGNSYLWSEAHDLSNILSQESKIGFLRSFVCYPCHPNSDPFRCCVSIRNIMLPSPGRPKKGSFLPKQSDEGCSHILHDLDKSKKRFIHQLALSSPLIVHNYLPEAVSLTVESGGVTRTALLSEVETSFHHIDSSHDLALDFYMHGFKPSVLKFPRTETFSTMAKLRGTKFFLSETMVFDPVSCNGPIYVTVEKMMDTSSGARELCIFVPFHLYNCTGFPLIVSDSANDMKGTGCVIPSCYDLVELELLQGEKDGLGLLSSNQNSYIAVPHIDSPGGYFSKNHIISTRKNVISHLGRFRSKPLTSSVSYKICEQQTDRYDLEGQNMPLNGLKRRKSSSSQFSLWDSDFVGDECGQVKACMYSPSPISSSSEIMVRVGRFSPDSVAENVSNSSWSGSFSLLPPSGSINVLVPQSSSSSAAFIVSLTASPLPGPFAGRTQAITFQPRYVISNACSKDLCFKQKGTDFVYHLGTGEHSHLHWTDTTRELLVSIRFNEPGWQWSGSFLPDHLGDTQVKMRNYVSGALNMIRVEVQNADVSIRDEKVTGNHHGNSGTNLILLSDDDTGYMPYRIDNFSKERLRIYQQKCETFETIVHPYTSCPYAWDEPCYLHRLTVEVPGERVVGSYALDDVKEYMPVYLPSTSEKPERKLHLSVHSVGATKVLIIIDSSYHSLKDMKDSGVPQFREKRREEQKTFVDYKEKISLMIPYIGISLINSYPQELLYACAMNVTINLLQNLDQQKLSFQISSLQIDNQLPMTPYPVILSFDHEYRSNLAGHIRNKEIKSERILQITSDSSCEPVFCLAVARWRKKDISLVSFEYISLRVADFRLELEQEVILGLFDFFRTVSSRFQSRILPFSDPTLHPLIYDMGFIKESSTHAQPFIYMKSRDNQLHSMNVLTYYKNHESRPPLPSIVPIGAPWQQIYLLARRQKKIYVELFDLAPIKLSLSFSSAPWMHRNGLLTSGESLIHRGLMALADVEGAQIHLKQLTITHQMASWESIQEILIRHYIRQLLHEMYKVFGSAGVIGNPLGFARSMGLGIRDFLSVPARSILQSPTGLITGVAQGTSSLLSNTVYAVSDAATQFSKAAHKGIVAFAFDDQAVARMEKQQKGAASHSDGVINEVLEGLTGLLQSPIKGAEKHGLPGILSGIAVGITGLVARPAASILEVTGRTAQSIRSRSRLYQMGPQRYRVRLPRPLSREFPLQPYSWEEAVGKSVLGEADEDLKLKNEILVMCKALKQAGKFIVITERLILIVSSDCLVDFANPEFQGVAVNLQWVIESEISLESVIHADIDERVVHIVGSSSDALLRQSQHQLKKGGGTRTNRWSNFPTLLPLFQTNLELEAEEDAEDLLRVLLSTIEQGKERGWGSGHLLHQSNIK